MHPLFDVLVRDIRTDIQQMAEEGHDQNSLLAELERRIAGGSLDALAALQEELWSLPSPPGFPYVEPNDWDSLSRHFPDPESHDRFKGTPRQLADRILGGWLGRCVGCQLGKPLERGLGPEEIKHVLSAVGSWPLTDYMNPLPAALDIAAHPKSELLKKFANATGVKGKLAAVQPDDDIHYAICGQLVLEEFGPEFTSQQVANRIIALTPTSNIWAAGKNMFRTVFFGLPLSHAAICGNPSRQSLGAMIRCDPWGWGAPANPGLAARMAYKDAICSQTRNGIYAGVFFAVLLADTLAHGDPLKAIHTAGRYIPPQSRFAEMLKLVQAECAREPSWEKANAVVLSQYPAEARRINHSLTNAAIVLLGLLKGEYDFTKTVGITVMCGLDTDCTGATVGSILGCALGSQGIGAHWTAPLHDTVHTDLPRMAELKISALAARMFKVAERNVRFAGG